MLSKPCRKPAHGERECAPLPRDVVPARCPDERASGEPRKIGDAEPLEGQEDRFAANERLRHADGDEQAVDRRGGAHAEDGRHAV